MNYPCEKLDLTIPRLKTYAMSLRFGSSQALTRRELETRWGCSDRAVRLIVAAIRKHQIGGGVLVGSNAGYFYTENPIQIRAWIKRSRKHCASFQEQIQGAEAMLAKLEGRG